MATAQTSPELPKPSFAKIAASVSQNGQAVGMHRAHQAGRSTDPAAVASPMDGPMRANAPSLQASLAKARASADVAFLDPLQRASPTSVDQATERLGQIGISSRLPDLIISESEYPPSARTLPIVGRESCSDESQKADSNSELGTKPPSLDGKSITSGTTFALDEKESLRPDDSASVKAAAEDDDAFSIRGSLLAASRMGSDIAARARGIQLGDMPERRLIPPVSASLPQGVLTPQSTSSEQQPSVNPSIPLGGAPVSSDALNVIYRQTPDEKLLEALANPRDRLFLLRLETDVVGFVENSKEPYMDLPPSNSFCRMLTHKLADYYHMTHSFEPQVGSVRIFRTPFCRVPPSLSSMSPQSGNPDESSPAPPPVLPRKIMRRGQDSEAGVMSSAASKATSETGSDSKDKPNPLNQKLSREEREELYKVARERIFGTSEEPLPEAEGNEMSRASSVSTNNRSNTGKRNKTGKQRRDHSDSFDSRHQYAPYWGAQQPTWVAQQPQQLYGAASVPAGQFPLQNPGVAQSQMMSVYESQGSPYPPAPAVAPNPSYSTFPVPQYPAHPNQPRFQSPGGAPMDVYGAGVPPPAPSQAGPPVQAWPTGYNAGTYPPQPLPAPAGPQNQHGVPYQYGQLPAHANPHDPKSQHPIPGSYNRNHAFNPATQSFVPGGAAMPPALPPQPVQPPYAAPRSHHGSPRIGAPHVAYPSYPHPISQPYGGGYSMARQGSNNSMHAYHHTLPHVNQHPQQGPPVMGSPQIPLQHANPNTFAARPGAPPAAPQGFTHLPNYGNPATLPQKPASGM